MGCMWKTSTELALRVLVESELNFLQRSPFFSEEPVDLSLRCQGWQSILRESRVHWALRVRMSLNSGLLSPQPSAGPGTYFGGWSAKAGWARWWGKAEHRCGANAQGTREPWRTVEQGVMGAGQVFRGRCGGSMEEGARTRLEEACWWRAGRNEAAAEVSGVFQSHTCLPVLVTIYL